ncbi:MAG: ABC transporter transmembrane domain-containing protein, partial [Victivallales bacterium]
MESTRTSETYGAVPDMVREILQRDHPGEETIIALSSDIAGHRHYGAEWLVVTNKTVLVYCSGEKGDAVPCHDIPLASLKKAKISPHVGIMSILVEPKIGSPFKIISFSQVLNPFFAHAAEDISRLVNNEQVSDKSALTGKVCPSCRKPIPEELNKCPRCTDRKGTLLRISQFAGAYKRTLILILLTMTAGTGFGLITPYMSKLFIEVILKPDPVTGEFVNKSWIGPAALILLAAYALQLFLSGIQEWLSGILGFKTVADVRQCIYEKLQELSLGFFDKHQTGALLARVNQDTQEMQRLLVDFIPITIESILMFFGIGIFLFILSWQLTLFVLIPVFMIVIFV